MSDAYISMLIESQKKKLELLEQAIELDKQQEDMITGDSPDMEALNANITAKGALVDELNKLDDGFESVYSKVRDELMNNKDAHKDEIHRLQELIRLYREGGVYADSDGVIGSISESFLEYVNMWGVTLVTEKRFTVILKAAIMTRTSNISLSFLLTP